MTQNVTAPAQSPRDAASLVPPVDVVEDTAGITLYADLPGVPKDRLHLHVEGDSLTIEGEIALDAPAGTEATHTEVGLARYRRVFTLSRELDPGKINAEFVHGVLTLRIPKAERALPRRIAIAVD